ncbi:hypothetical protein [Candidatus Chordibacter forsetii]|uniref:hypothetical protein n=1 Tax=Candidatus Chordibacter forsetii TaxID=3381758 RepID=UPI0038997E77
MEILSRILDDKSAPFVVAELSGNHGGGLAEGFQYASNINCESLSEDQLTHLLQDFLPT